MEVKKLTDYAKEKKPGIFSRLAKRCDNAIKRFSEASLKTNICAIALMSVVTAFILEIFCRRSLLAVIKYIIAMPVMFAVNALIVMLTLLPALLIKRRIPYIFTVGVLWLALGISNAVVLAYRADPLSAIDFLVVKSMLGMATIYFTVWQLILIGIAVAAVIAALVLMIIKLPKFRVDYKKAIITLLVSIAAFVILRIFAVPIVTGDYEAGKLADAYGRYGFTYSFTHSLFSQGVEKPENYSDEELDAKIKEVSAKVIKDIPRQKPNIVIVQLESFFDIKDVKGIDFSSDPTPSFTELKKNGISGRLRVPHIGGGTSNVEFEVLTGMSLDHFGFGEYPYTTVLKGQGCESIAANLKNHGYKAHAMHDHIATFYDRNLAYASLGFDTFTPVELMTDIERNPLGWVKDKVFTDEITSALDSTKGQDLVFAVSVQAHGKYPEAKLESSESGSTPYKVAVSGIADDELRAQYEYYVNQIHEMDAFVGELIKTLEKRGEPCIAVFYGDHLPALPLNESDLKSGDMYLTEYAVWSNIPLGGCESDDMNTLDLDLDANRLSAYLMQLCGMNDGDITKLHQYELATGDIRDKLLQNLEYSQLYDDSEIEYKRTNITYGTRRPKITSCTLSDGTVTVKGENFSEHCTVKLDGLNLISSARYVNSNTLIVENVLFPAESVEVTVQTIDGTVLASVTADVTN